MTDLTDGARYLDRYGDTWEARDTDEGTHLLLVAKVDYGPVTNGWYETAHTIIRDYGPMTALGPEQEQQ